MIVNTPPPRIDNSMTLPVGRLAAPVEPVNVWNSVQTVALELQNSGLPALPVTQDGLYIGMVTENDLARALAVGTPPESPVKEILANVPPALKGFETGAQALRTFTEFQVAALAVTDEVGRVIGVLLPSRLLAPSHQESRPKIVGGMATPLGVYLSTGAVNGGVPSYALFLTGAAMFTMFYIGIMLAQGITMALPTSMLEVPAVLWALNGLSVLTFLLLLRAVPLAGYHGAEHMVVHAIEQGEPLTPEVVRRMPRVHPRCGTNFAVAAVIFLSIFGFEGIPDQSLRLLLAFLVTMVFFRPIGSFVQYYLTTRRPNEKQLAAGIAAGKDLLARYQTARTTNPTPLKRLLNSGIFHIMAGSIVTATLIAAILTVLNVPEQWLVPLGI